MNLGLAAWSFDPVHWRPHPPGTPGYVLLLQAVHALAPGLQPVAVARVGSALCAAATVPAAFWVVRGALGPAALGRPLAAAALAATHPLLWYAGADGQSHAAEALGATLLFGLALRCRGAGLLPALGLVCATAAAGSIRPTLALLSAPLLVWVLWGRRPAHWLAAIAVGAATVALWAALALAQTDPALWSRAQDALVFELFVSRFGLLGGSFDPVLFAVNAQIVALGLGLALLPALAWQPGRGSWRPALWATVAVNAAFYLLLYASEPGYLAAVAGLAVLTPATWGPRPPLRAGVALLAGLGFVAGGPATAPLLGVRGEARLWLPTVAHVLSRESGVEDYLAGVCPWGERGGALVLDRGGEHLPPRLAALRCDVDVAVHVAGLPHKPELDAVLIFSGHDLRGLPTGVPLEAGEPLEARHARPVAWVLLAPGVGPAFGERIGRAATCPPVQPGVWSAACLPVAPLGQTTLRIQASARAPE